MLSGYSSEIIYLVYVLNFIIEYSSKALEFEIKTPVLNCKNVAAV